MHLIQLKHTSVVSGYSSGGFEPKRSENDRGDRGLAPVSSDISAIQSIRLPFRFRLLLHHKGQREVHESPEAAYQARAAV